MLRKWRIILNMCPFCVRHLEFVGKGLKYFNYTKKILFFFRVTSSEHYSDALFSSQASLPEGKGIWWAELRSGRHRVLLSYGYTNQLLKDCSHRFACNSPLITNHIYCKLQYYTTPSHRAFRLISFLPAASYSCSFQ